MSERFDSTLLVITGHELAAGYRLAGTAVEAVDSPEQAADRLRELLDRGGNQAVIAVHEPLLEGVDAALRRAVEESTRPLVIGMPAGVEPEAGEDREARLRRLLASAVGYEITFEGEAGASE